MKAYVCLFTVLGIAFVGVLGVVADISQAREDSRLADSIHAKQLAVLARTEARRQIVAEVIAGRLTLPVAADKFGELNAKDPETMTTVRSALKGASDQECLCRQVILYVKAELEGRSSKAETIIPRLESEMHEHFGEYAPEN